MKKTNFLLALTSFIQLQAQQKTYIPDDAFEQELIDLGLDVVLDDSVLTNNINTLDTLFIYSNNSAGYIVDLTGIEEFLALRVLRVYYNNIHTIDVSSLVNLRLLDLTGNNLTQIDVSNNQDLAFLNITNNNFSSIDLSSNQDLRGVYLQGNQFTNLADLLPLNNLEVLTCGNNPLDYIDITTHTDLIYFDFAETSCERVMEFSNNPELIAIVCSDATLDSLDLSGCPKLDVLYCDNNNIDYLDVSHLDSLTVLHAWANPLTEINLSTNAQLTELYLNGTQIKSLDLI